MAKKKCIICKVKPVAKDRSTHHLKPKWGNGDTSREHPTDTCNSCHKDIHRLFRNGELYEKYNTIPKLRKELEHRRIQDALRPWFERNKAGLAELVKAPASYVEYAECMHLQSKLSPSKQEVMGSSPIPSFHL